MAQPARYGLQGTADPTTRKAGAASGTQARPASRTRQAPVTRQQPGKGKKGKGKGTSQGNKVKKPDVDILSPAAMLNLYYIAHNVADCLYLRGFRWPGAPKPKKGKKKT